MVSDANDRYGPLSRDTLFHCGVGVYNVNNF